MAFARTNFGIEYNPRPTGDDESFPWALVLVPAFLLTAVSFTVVKLRAPATRPEPVAEAQPSAEPETPPEAPRRENSASSSLPGVAKRPALVKNLLARLEGAEANRDTEMAIDTIERLRALPGSPAADLDDALARRLGTLNLRKLYVLKSREWVKELTVKRGDSLERLSRENGATLASSLKLNQLADGNIKIGQKILVMKHPRFNLVVHCKPGYADLFFMGKFFKRYYLAGETSVKEADFRLKDIALKSADREELSVLLPSSATVLVSEF